MQRRSLLLTGTRRLEWVSETLPPPGPDQVLVENRTGAVSIGAELPQYTGMVRSSAPPSYPRMTGYESVGRVLACGSSVTQLEIGKRVVATYGHRTHALVRADRAIPVPDRISDALAVLAILTCDVARGIRKLELQPGEVVLVSGAGAIGLIALFVLRAMGFESVEVVEPQETRRRLAYTFGARAALSPSELAANQQAYPAALECSSRNAAFDLVQQKMARQGRICILADGNVEPMALAPGFHDKELCVVGSSDGEDYPGHARWFFSIVRDDPRLELLFDHRISAPELPAAFEQIVAGDLSPIKVLVHY